MMTFIFIKARGVANLLYCLNKQYNYSNSKDSIFDSI